MTTNNGLERGLRRPRAVWSAYFAMLIFCLAVMIVVKAYCADASSPPPYRPPLDYSQEAFDKLLEKLVLPRTQERESAAYCLGDRLRWRKHRGDLRQTYHALRDALRSENDLNVKSVLTMSLSNIFLGEPNSARARLFNEEKGYWLSILAESDEAPMVQTTLHLIGHHKAGWADAAVAAELSFPDESVKIEACKTIVSLNLSVAQPVLRSLLREKDASGSLHVACARTLGKVGTIAAIPDLTTAADFHKSKGRSVAEYELAIREIRRRFSATRSTKTDTE